MATWLLLALTVAGDPVVLEPTDDVWVYAFAQDPTDDPYLRAWGSEDGAVGSTADDQPGFSYSLLRFEIPADLPEVEGATLRLVHTPDPGFDAQTAEANPLEARAATGDFEEGSWTFSLARSVYPVSEEAGVFGRGWAHPGDVARPFAIEIDLLAGPNDFRRALSAAKSASSRRLVVALTTPLRPQGAGEATIYRLYSRHNDAERRPRLILEPKVPGAAGGR